MPDASGGTRQAAGEVEWRGNLADSATGKPALLVLRRGVLRIFPGVAPKARHRGLPEETVQLVHKSEVRSESDGQLRIRTHVPYDAEHVFKAKNEAEAKQWCQALQTSLKAAAERLQGHLQFLAQGSTAYKYNYSNSKRMRRHFWVDEAKAELCWGKARNDDSPQTMDLTACVGIIYGPVTSTFQRCRAMEDPSWCCFSLLFPDRTLDLAVAGEAISHWFLGLQHVLVERSSGCVTALSEAQFVFRKVFHKLSGAAHRQGLTTRTMLRKQLRALGRDPSSLGPSVAPAAASADLEAKGERRRKKRESKVEASPTSASDGGSGAALRRRTSAASAGGAGTTVAAGGEARHAFAPPAREGASAPNGTAVADNNEEEEDFRKLAVDLGKELEAATARLEALGPKWAAMEAGGGAAAQASLSGFLAEALRSDSVTWQAEKCSELERELLTLHVENGTTQRQLLAAERAEKQLKKLAKQFRDSEMQVQAMEQELGSVEAGAQIADKAKQSSDAALERTEAQTVHLQRRVQELEQQLSQADSGGAAELALLQEQNKKQAEKLQSLQRDRGELSQKLDALTKEVEAVEQRRQEKQRKLEACQGLSRNLVELLRGLQGSVDKLREEQQQVKSKCQDDLRSIADDFLPLTNVVQKIGASRANMEQRYQEVSEERKKLHNLVLELKGNIRVFVRVRPMNEKEKAAEAAGESTITFAEDCKISVYEANNSRRKWFEFDKAFPPKCTQQEVFEEVMPLATSVLDGYNVCIFAYGQTGSGKTFTMTGNKENPGLNVRVLTELFRIRDERRLDTDINISLMITEIYNETIKDLFVTRQKKLDVKQNTDGTNSVPGLTEIAVHSVEEVLKAMADASGNRTVMATDMNEESSRSHSIVQVKTICKSKKDKREYVGKINLIDLAGSENVNKSGVSGQGMKEAQNINKSLSALGDVIQALVAKTPHVPYRNSKLTMMLKDSLGGDAKTLMIVQSSPAQINVVETLSSLNFAARARNVELGKAKRNVKGGD